MSLIYAGNVALDNLPVTAAPPWASPRGVVVVLLNYFHDVVARYSPIFYYDAAGPRRGAPSLFNDNLPRRAPAVFAHFGASTPARAIRCALRPTRSTPPSHNNLLFSAYGVGSAIRTVYLGEG